MTAIEETFKLVIRAFNLDLRERRQNYRLEQAGTMVTRFRGYTIIAFKETQDAADWSHCGSPRSNMGGNR